MPQPSYRRRPVMCGHIPDRCVRACLRMEALWQLQPAAAALVHCIATIGQFSQTNDPRQRRRVCRSLSCCLQAQYLRGCHRGIQICTMSLTTRQKARVNKVLAVVPATTPSEEEEDPPDEEREGERDVWKGVMLTPLLYRVRLTSGTLPDRQSCPVVQGVLFFFLFSLYFSFMDLVSLFVMRALLLYKPFVEEL